MFPRRRRHRIKIKWLFLFLHPTKTKLYIFPKSSHQNEDAPAKKSEGEWERKLSTPPKAISLPCEEYSKFAYRAPVARCVGLRPPEGANPLRTTTRTHPSCRKSPAGGS